MGYSFTDLVKSFFDISRDHENVASITKIELLGQVYTSINRIAIVDC